MTGEVRACLEPFASCHSDPAPAKAGGNEEEGEESRSAQGKLREGSAKGEGGVIQLCGQFRFLPIKGVHPIIAAGKGTLAG